MDLKTKKTIDELRQAMGTLPSQHPKMATALVRGCSKLQVEMVPKSGPSNPYRTLVEAAGATWGNNFYHPKWEQLSPENRFRVALAVLTRNTLPQAVEPPTWTWRVYGTPRHCFDQHCRARIGATFFSIGCRDNCKLDSDFILYSDLFDRMFDGVEQGKGMVLLEDTNTLRWIQNKGTLTDFGRQAIRTLLATKEMYKQVIDDGKGSWQTARAFLPMSYHHPYHFSMNFLALQGQCARRMQFCEEEFIVGLHWLLRETIREKFPLMANYLRPGCDFNHKCGYAKNYALSNAFGCLFAGCGRYPSGTEYATFNTSCTDMEAMRLQLGIDIPRPEDWIEYDHNDYEKLDEKDKLLFEED